MKTSKLRIQNRVLRWALAIISAFGLSGIAFAESASFRELLAEKLSEKLVANVESALGILPAEEELGLANIDVSATGLTNLRVGGKRCYGSSSSTYIYRCGQLDVESWPVGTNTLAFQNTRSTTSTVESVLFDMTGTRAQTASSSFSVSCGTSSQQFAPAPGEVFGQGANGIAPFVLNQLQIATGTQIVYSSLATSSPGSNIASGVEIVGTGNNYASPPPSLVLVPPNAYLVCRAEMPNSPNRMCDSAGVQCEAVTSSNRGWIANMSVEWSWTEGL